jgi:hypothetical protein
MTQVFLENWCQVFPTWLKKPPQIGALCVPAVMHRHHHATRSTIMCLISAITLAGFRPLGQTWAQFMIV